MHEALATVVAYVVPAIQAIGVAIVIWGVVESAARVLQREWRILRGGTAAWSFGGIRIAIGRKTVLGLEFFVASDVIQTGPSRCMPGLAPAARRGDYRH